MHDRSRRAARPAAFALALLALLAAAPATPGTAAPRPSAAAVRQNRIFFTARAPWGEPGAIATLEPACGDPSHRDTLYLCFEPAGDESTFYGVAGEILVYAQPSDTLGSFWAMEHGGANNGGLVVQFGPDESFPGPQPWPAQGIGTALYDRTAQSGRFRFVYAMPLGSAGPVRAGTRYVLGRVVLGARRAGLAGCERPVCLEWHAATVQYRAGEKVVVDTGERWLARGTTADRCRDRIPAWRPK